MAMEFNYKIYEKIFCRDKKLEPFILKSNKSSYEYAKRILGRRWRPAEKVILDFCNDEYPYHNSPNYVYLYAKNVIKKRWPEGETALINFHQQERNLHFTGPAEALILYAKHVIKDRWKEVEKFIVQGNQIGNYLEIIKNPKDVKEFQNIIQLHALKGVKTCINFNTWNPNFTFKLPGKKAFNVMVLRNIYKDKSRGAVRIAAFENSNSSPDYLIFQQKEWLDLANVYNNKNHCRTQFGCHSLTNLSAEEISKNVTYINNRRYYYTPRKDIPKVKQLKVNAK